MSLENHLAFAAVKAGNGSLEQMSRLLRVVYLGYYLRDETASGGDVEHYRQAEQALARCAERAIQSNAAWTLMPDEQQVVGQLLVLLDAQLAEVPVHRFVRARERLDIFVAANQGRSIVD
ncbi:hypothetical protein [Paraburkholderia adhaesiva]|uniref:hypothetical protein n=1 Tax=Paraburkholderia adhaesiva TaxID=2883244 RepID=UPI001F274DB0|nr:hypothetical protein [Paraburkholderia adhaesiva]